MAYLTITEVEEVTFTLVNGQVVMAPKMPPITEQTLPIAGVSAPCAAFDKRTRYVMLNCDTACGLAWSLPGAADPVAINNKHRMSANADRFCGVTPGGKLAVITAA